MDEQEVTEARTLIAEVRAMLKEGTQAVRDLRDLHARFEGQLVTSSPAPGSSGSDSRLTALESEVSGLTGRLDQFGSAGSDRLAMLEAEMRQTVQRLELRASAAVTALNTLRAGGQP